MIFNKKDNIKSFIQYSKDEANKQRLIGMLEGIEKIEIKGEIVYRASRRLEEVNGVYR